MGISTIKKLTVLFGISIVGILACLVMTVLTGIKEHEEKSKPVPLTIPTPALPNG